MSFFGKRHNETEPENAALPPAGQPVLEGGTPDGEAPGGPFAAPADAVPPVFEAAGAEAAGQPEDGPPAEEGTADEKKAKPPLTPEEKARRRRHRRRALRRAVPTLLISVLYLVLAGFMFHNAIEASRGGTSISMRYNLPVPAAKVASIKHQLANPDETADFSTAFWYDSPAETLATSRASATTPTLFVDGDMSQVLGVQFVHGSYPGALEKRGLALSEGLAWQLFGGTEISGSTIEWGGKTYTVRGVFAGDDLMLLAQVDAAEVSFDGFTGVELTGAVEGDPREAADAFAKAVGLGEADSIVSAGSMAGLLWAMAWAPVAVLCLWFLVRLLGLLRHTGFWPRQIVLFGVLLAAALLLPKALDLLPGWMVPTRWSDLDHWGNMFTEISARITEWLSLRPSFWDIQVKRQLLYQLVLLVPALFALWAVIRRWAQHMRRADVALRVAAPQKSGAPATAATPHEHDEHDDILLLKAERQRQKKNPRS